MNHVEVSKAFLFIVICVAALSSCSESEIESLTNQWASQWQVVADSGVGGGRLFSEKKGETYTFREDGSFENESNERGIFLVTGDRFMLAIIPNPWQEDSGVIKGYFGTWMMSKSHLYLDFHDPFDNNLILKKI